jgi:hypothetical protein
MKVKSLVLFLVAFVSGCVVRGEPVQYKAGVDTLELNAKVDGRTLTAWVFADGQAIITHHWPPFVNSRDEQDARYKGHDIRSVLRIIKGLGNTTVQIYVYVDGGDAVEFFF